MTDRYRRVLCVPVHGYNNFGTEGIDLLVDEMKLNHLVLRTGSDHVTMTRPELRSLARGITAYLDREEFHDGKAPPASEVKGSTGQAAANGNVGDNHQRGVSGDPGDNTLESTRAPRGATEGEGSKAKAVAEAIIRAAFPDSFPPDSPAGGTPDDLEGQLIGQALLFTEEFTK